MGVSLALQWTNQDLRGSTLGKARNAQSFHPGRDYRVAVLLFIAFDALLQGEEPSFVFTRTFSFCDSEHRLRHARNRRLDQRLVQSLRKSARDGLQLE